MLASSMHPEVVARPPRNPSRVLAQPGLAGMVTAMALLTLLVVSARARAQTDPSPANGKPASANLDFGRDIRPLLAKRCFSCHGPGKDEAGLRLHSAATATAKLESGQTAIVPGTPNESELLRRIATTDEFQRMPPEGEPLSAAEIEKFQRWIAAGAVFENHWAFRPLTSPPSPAVRNADWVANPIDAFVLARLEASGLSPNPPAKKAALLRRLTFNLTGLPPTPEETAAFVSDDSSAAWRKAVDRLLASERYGERWARHWLDLVRYAETNSFERDGAKPNAWRYRDYVIRSFNDDKPYDRFILEQLAGDELPDRNAETIIATGYYRLGLWDDEPADAKQARYDELDDIVSTTGQVFLGLTINCARCHDHKIDPIPQADYYRLLAFFQDVPSYGHRGDQRSYNQTDISSPEVARQHEEVDAQKRELDRQLREIEQSGIVKMPGADQRITEGNGRQKLLDEKLKNYLNADQWQTYQRLQEGRRKLQELRLPPREMALSVTRCEVNPAPTHILFRGSPHAPTERVEPGFPSIFSTPDPRIPAPPQDARSSGRRTVLANWIASPENMLTARVIVNRVWQQHFGRGLVASPNNFGLLGAAPTHPELLDWLATELIRSGWRLKSLQRLIALSNTYQMSSTANEAALARDPQNLLLWRYDMRRLSAEEIRDAIHAVNGTLNLRMFGPSFYPELGAEVLAGQSRPGEGWGRSSPEEQSRRAIYGFVKRSLLDPLLVSFDLPDTDSSCDARFVTTQPAQALALINGQFLQKQSAAFAARLQRECGDDRTAQVAAALRYALSREANIEEIADGQRLMASWQEKHGLSGAETLRYYCLYVYNLNEFAYLD